MMRRTALAVPFVLLGQGAAGQLLSPAAPTYGERQGLINPRAIADFMDGNLPSGITLTRASAGTRINSLGRVVSEATNVARFTHNPVSLALQGLLIEPARTNIVPWSQTLTGNWTSNGATPSAAAGITAPDGSTANVTTITENSANSNHDVFRSMAHVQSVPYSYRAILKAGTRSAAYVCFYDGSAAYGAYFDLVAGTVGGKLPTGGAPATKSITPLGNGWYACEVTATTAGVLGNVFVRLAIVDGGEAYQGNGTGAVYHWNSQHEVIEAASQCSSVIIANAGATVTRAADVATWALPNGTYDITLDRVSGRTSLSGVVVSGGYTIPTDVSPLRSVRATRRS